MSVLKRALRIGGLAGLAVTGYAAYSQYAIRRFEHLDPLNADAPGSYIDIDGTAVQNKIAATVAGAQLGHKDPSTTMKHYTDIALYVQRDAVNVVANAILNAAKNDS